MFDLVMLGLYFNLFGKYISVLLKPPITFVLVYET